jgi:hypothetical protein
MQNLPSRTCGEVQEIVSRDVSRAKIKKGEEMTEAKTETAIAVAEPSRELTEVLKQPPQSAKVTRLASFTPGNLTESIALAKLMARSDLVPKEYKNRPENVLIGMQYASELGIPPLLGLQNISIINGRACVWGDLFLGIIQTSPAYEWHKEWFEGEGDNFGAVCQMKRKGQEVHTVRFTVADAKQAKLWGKRGYQGQDTPWITNPKRMLQARSRGFCGRDKFADALKGLIIAEEAMDLPVDTSDAKKQRDAASLDITTVVADLKTSAEPNRGHDQTGLQRTDMDKVQPKKEDTICADCQVINGHAPDCKHAAKAEQDRRTSKGTTKAAYLILSVEKRTKKDTKEPFLVLNVVSPENKEGKLTVWHQSLHEYLVGKSDVSMVCEIADKTTKQGKRYLDVEHILELGNVKFVNDRPAETAAMAEQQGLPMSEPEEDF